MGDEYDADEGSASIFFSARTQFGGLRCDHVASSMDSICPLLRGGVRARCRPADTALFCQQRVVGVCSRGEVDGLGWAVTTTWCVLRVRACSEGSSPLG